MRYAITGPVLLFLIVLTGCAHRPDRSGPSPAGAVITGNQLLVAAAESRDTSLVELYALARTPRGWEITRGPFPGIIGRNGFALPGEKREGDGRAPTGLFALESAFGYAPAIDSRMPYRQATENDLWVDDVQSPDYNTWVKRGESSANSFEMMKMADHRYKLGLVTGYNRNPIVKGLGSAIFAHMWLEEGYTTTGCLAFDENEMVRLLSWLDPAEQPQILMGTVQDLAAVEGLPRIKVGAAKPGLLEQQIRNKVAGIGERIVEYRSADGFFGMAFSVPPKVADKLSLTKSRQQNLQVPIADLSYLVVTHWGSDGKPQSGELILRRNIALPVVKAFAGLFSSKCRIEKMDLVEQYETDLDSFIRANKNFANCLAAGRRHPEESRDTLQ
jgi:L,D-peptidoglycan transpeptidase YkuD (ErfK/YbiS/YcfS/YnhG family)